MANVASAEKRNRQRIRRRERNVFQLSTVRTFVKRVRTAIEAKDGKKAQAALKIAIQSIDKAAQKGVLDRKAAARKISRLTVAVNRVA